MKPTNEADLSEIIAGAQTPLRIFGGGTRPLGNPVDGQDLSTARLSGISLYEPGALTIVAGAGTPVAEIEAELAKEGQRLAFEPMDHCGLMGTEGVATIGGVVAANVSGPRRIQAGAARDFLLGVRFVDGQGRVLKNGGRVMKNVTGYDLVKLMAGSYGTLGVISEVALKVLPRPETQVSVVLGGLDDIAAIGALSKALGSPFDVTGAAHVPKGKDGQPATMIRLEGFEDSVEYRAGAIRDLWADIGDAEVLDDAGKTTEIWQEIRDVAAFRGGHGDVWRISVKPGDAPGIVARMEATEVLYDWGGGLIWALVAQGTDLRGRLGKFRGHATLLRASDECRAKFGVFQPEPAPLAAISAGLRQKFDPRGILNPGLMG